MIPVLRAAQLRSADAWTIQHEPIASIDLMERAASACTTWLTSRYGRETRFRILCGPGNNGGDGLALARQLFQSGYEVVVDRLVGGARPTEDHQTNLRRLQQLIGRDVREVDSMEAFAPFDPETVVVDALFGSGLSRPLEGLFREAVKYLNDSDATVVSIDLPSGLPTDEWMQGWVAVRADYTLSFQTPKRTFFFPETGESVGQWVLLDIGVRGDWISSDQLHEFLFTRSDAVPFFAKRPRFAHKGDFGHGCLIAGSTGKLGAALLAARAALRTGTGLLTVHLPISGFSPLQTAVPEAMVSTSAGTDRVTDIPDDADRFDAIAIGPGLGTDPSTGRMLESLLRTVRVPLLIDADGLNILAMEPTLLKRLPAGTILTPHPGEFVRLFGQSIGMADRIARAREFTRASGCVLVLKGGCTAVVLPSGEVRYNANGNPGMAKGGSGDALTGIILGLLCNGLPPESAASTGVFLHAAAGDLAAKKYGERGMLPSDLIRALPAVLQSLEKSS